MEYKIILGTIKKEDIETIKIFNEVYKLQKCMQVLRSKW